ncbi:MAG: peptide deformylase [Coriobacteriales bacterium]
MDIIIAPNPILRQKCEDIVLANEPDIKQFAKDMAKAMYDANGCGLAAPQVGVAKKLIVVDCDYADGDKSPIYLVNPYVESTSGEPIVDEEGCLSIPGITIPVSRCEDAVIKGIDLDGEPVTIEAKGFLARCMQHEIDHLSGITLFETLPVVERLSKLEEYKAALEMGKVPGEVD